jgi:hypothetical protein
MAYVGCCWHWLAMVEREPWYPLLSLPPVARPLLDGPRFVCRKECPAREWPRWWIGLIGKYGVLIRDG